MPGRSARIKREQVGQDADRDALERADDDPPRLAGAQAGEVVVGPGEALEDGAGVVVEHPAHRGQLDRAGTAWPIEHGLADDALEGGDLLADRRLGEAEAARRPAEGAFVGHRLEGEEVADLDIAEGGHGSSVTDGTR